MTSRLLTLAAILCGSLALAAPVAEGNCTREFLISAASAYADAQTAGDISKMKLASSVVFVENGKSGDIAKGMLSQAVKIDHVRSTYDTVECATYTELIAATNSHPYVLGSQIRYKDGAVADMETVVTDKGDWLFDAASTLKYAQGEKWDEIAAADRSSREVIKAAGDAYCDIFSNKSVVVPWGQPCARLEGGSYTGNGSPTDKCDVGIPSGVSLTARRYVIDEVFGTVDIMMRFAGLPDTHEFRVEKGKLRYVHTMTVMNQ